MPEDVDPGHRPSDQGNSSGLCQQSSAANPIFTVTPPAGGGGEDGYGTQLIGEGDVNSKVMRQLVVVIPAR